MAYGNPDGPQQREDVVAIPKWVIEGKNSGWILGVYGAVFGVLLPYLVVRLAFTIPFTNLKVEQQLT